MRLITRKNLYSVKTNSFVLINNEWLQVTEVYSNSGFLLNSYFTNIDGNLTDLYLFMTDELIPLYLADTKEEIFQAKLSAKNTKRLTILSMLT